jgi:hypothetical protein
MGETIFGIEIVAGKMEHPSNQLYAIIELEVPYGCAAGNS